MEGAAQEPEGGSIAVVIRQGADVIGWHLRSGYR